MRLKTLTGGELNADFWAPLLHLHGRFFFLFNYLFFVDLLTGILIFVSMQSDHFPPFRRLEKMDSSSYESCVRAVCRLIGAARIYATKPLLWEDSACFHRSVVPNISCAAVDRRMCSAWEEWNRLKALVRIIAFTSWFNLHSTREIQTLFFLLFLPLDISMRWFIRLILLVSSDVQPCA